MYYRYCSTPRLITTRVDFKKACLYARRGLLSTDTTYVPNASAASWLEKSGNRDGRNIDRSNPWNRYLAAGASGVSRTVVDGQRIVMSWTDGHQSEFSFKWLRDHCADAFNPRTRQRELDTYEVQNNVLVKNASVTAELPQNAVDPEPTGIRQHQVLRLRWTSDPAGPEHESTIRLDWLRQHCTSSIARDLRKRFGAATDGVTCQPDRVLWGEDVFAAGNNPPCLEYDEIMGGDQPQPTSGVASLVGFLRTHGIALVRGVPTDMVGTEALARKIGHPRSTLYGPGMWATSAEADSGEEAFQDSAYSKDSLQSHTDCTYLADPPGLQVFNCVCPAPKGGASTYVDGFAVGERLLQEHPEAFEFFSRVPLSYHCFDEGCHYMAEGPVFRLGALREIVEMRYNDYDRAPLDYLSNDNIDRFYEYHQYISRIIRDKAMVARVVLQPGDTVILNNHRTMHGRESFQGKRRLIGCYIGMDELASTARVCRL